EKTADSIWDVAPGVPGLETTLSILLDQVSKGKMSLPEVVQSTSERPALLYNLFDRGSLAEKNWADLVVVDMNKKNIIDSSLFFSKAKYSPFDKMTLKGKPIKTFVNGTLVIDDGKMVSSTPSGQLLL
ncbi:MAG: amidohydrolase family protein, partial [Candidatus Thermoplasmatota archaeon]|nr:amidohydrolase family protein [Candidatus Thermoplasmatota archaeon]